jgi:O-antigen/teichoic acid export membrane protein
MNNRLLFDYSYILFSRLISGFSIVALSFYIARVFGVLESGFFNFFWTVLLFLSVFSKFGYDYLSLKKIGVYASNLNFQKTNQFINTTFTWILSICVLIFGVYYLITRFYKSNILIDAEDMKAISFAVYSLLPFTIVIYMSSILKGFQSKVSAYILDQGGIALVFLIAIIFFQVNIYTDLLYVFLICCSIVMFLSYNSVQYYFRKTFQRKWLFSLDVTDFKAKIKDSSNYFVLTLSEFSLYWSPILFISLFNDLFDTGVYSNILRLSQIIVFFMAIINTLLAPKLAFELHKEDIDRKNLYRILKEAIKFNVFVGIPLLLFIVIITPSGLNFIGLNSSEYFWIILFLYSAQGIKLLNGPTIYVLTMSENGSIFSRKLAFLTLLSSIFLIPLCVYFYGLLGASISFFIITLLINIYAAYKLKTSFGVMILSLLG